MRRSRMLSVACGFAGTITLTAMMAAPSALADEGPAGSAYALSVHTTLLDAPLVKIDPVPTAAYPKGADESVVEIGPNLAGLVTAKALNASSDLEGGTLTSSADIAEVVVRDILSAKLVTAECHAAENGLAGSSSIAELRVLGQKIDVKATAAVNVLDVATVKINEQVKQGGTLTVNAVHVTVGGAVGGVTSADIVLSQARCAAGTSDGPDTPPSTSTTTSQPSGSESPAPTTGTSEPSHPATTTSDSVGDVQHDITPAADSEDLAETGVSAIVPISVGGLLLLAGGAVAIYFTRRRATNSPPSQDD